MTAEIEGYRTDAVHAIRQLAVIAGGSHSSSGEARAALEAIQRELDAVFTDDPDHEQEDEDC